MVHVQAFYDKSREQYGNMFVWKNRCQFCQLKKKSAILTKLEYTLEYTL